LAVAQLVLVICKPGLQLTGSLTEKKNNYFSLHRQFFSGCVTTSQVVVGCGLLLIFIIVSFFFLQKTRKEQGLGLREREREKEERIDEARDE